MAGLGTIIPNIWLDTEAEEAARFYTGIFPNSRITATSHYPPDAPREEGMVMTVSFELDGNPFTIINGGPEFTPDEAVSFEIRCADQAEVDFYWDALTADGGEPGPCGWLRDRFHVSWQVVPVGFEEIMKDPDETRAQRAFQAMLTMGKLDLAELQRAAAGAEG